MSLHPRSQPLNDLLKRRYDLVVVGGGIQGCGVARDAALRGFSVLLVEKGDLAQGSSSATSKLAHGGLRYLEQYRFSLVRESLREREILMRVAPHLVRPLPFLLPLYEGGGRGRWRIKAGLTLYDLLMGRGSTKRHHMLSAAQAVEREPVLPTRGLNGAAVYHDAQMNDARLVLENAIDAQENGAVILTRAEVVGLAEREQRIDGVTVLDRTTGEVHGVEAGLVVNAGGPWYQDIMGQQDLSEPRPVRLSRGTHIIVPAMTRGHGLLLQAPSDGRVFFVLPWKGLSLVGTTDVEYTGHPDALEAADADIEYLLAQLATIFGDDAPRREDVRAAFAGVRALVPGSEEDIGRVTREAQVREEAPGLLCVTGGKYTTYRAVAERAVDLAQTLLEQAHRSPCSTMHRLLPGGDVPEMNDYFRVAEQVLMRQYGLPVETLRYLLGTYGTRHSRVLAVIGEEDSHAEQLEEGLPFTRGEVIYAARHEFAMELDDVIWRRTYRGFLGPLSPEARVRWNDALQAGLNSRELVG